MKKYYDLHDLITVEIHDPPDIFHRWYMFETVNLNRDADIVIRFVPNIKDNGKPLHSYRHMTVTKEYIYFLQRHKLSFWEIKISNISNTLPITIDINCDPLFGPELFLQLIIEPLLTYLLPQKGALSLHASSLSYNNKGALFTSSTGVGKTSILLMLLKLSQTAYYSDDQTLVKDGILYPYPLEIGLRKHHLDRHNLKTTAEHSNKMIIHSIINMLLNFYPNLTERVSVEELDFGRGIPDKKEYEAFPVPLKNVFVLNLAEEVSIEKISPADAFVHILEHNRKNEDKLKILTNYLDSFYIYNALPNFLWDTFEKKLFELCQTKSINFYLVNLKHKYTITPHTISKIQEILENA